MPGERSGSVLADWDAGDRPAPGPPDADKYSSRAFGGIPSPRQRVCVAEVRSISIASIQVLKYQASFSKPGPLALGSSPLVVCGLGRASGAAGQSRCEHRPCSDACFSDTQRKLHSLAVVFQCISDSKSGVPYKMRTRGVSAGFTFFFPFFLFCFEQESQYSKRFRLLQSLWQSHSPHVHFVPTRSLPGRHEDDTVSSSI